MENKEKRENQSTFFKKWLETLQQESWQLELLISGFALFGIWEAKPFIDTIANYIEINQATGSTSIVANATVSILKAGWVIFFINLLIHIILRGLWIGAIGLRYVSNEIEYDALNYSEWMTSYLRRKVGEYDDYIERLEKLCSIIFAYTFLLFFIFLSAAIFFAELGILFTLLMEPKNGQTNVNLVGQSVVMVFMIFGLLVFIDFITLGVFKKVKDPTFAKYYGWIYKFYSYATFSFMYRALLYNFLDSKYTKRLFLFSMPYAFLIVYVLPTIYSNAHPHFPFFKEANNFQREVMREGNVSNYNYDELRENGYKTGFIKSRDPIAIFSLSSFEVSGPYLRTFISMLKSDQEILNDNDIDAFFKDGLRSTMLKNRKTDSLLTSIDVERDLAKSPILDKRRAQRNMLKKEGMKAKEVRLKLDPIYKSTLDSIDNFYDDKQREEIRNRYADIRSTILDLSTISIDGKIVEPNYDLAKFYTHPNAGEKGILYYIPIDSLSKGPHQVEIVRNTGYRNNDKSTNRELKMILPFLKMD